MHRPSSALAVAAVAAVLAWSSAACSSSSSGADGDPTVTTTPAPPLLVCSDIPYEPFEFADDGTLSGFDVDLVEALGDRIGRDPEFVATPLDQFASALDAGTCELVASALPIPDPASTSLVFSDPYLSVDQALLVRASDAARLATLDATAGATVGVVADSPSADLAAGELPSDAVLEPFATADDAIAALGAGSVDAVVVDAPLARHAARTDDGLVVTATRPTTTRYGLATNAARAALLGEVDAALAALQADGTLDRVTATWFGP